MIVGIRADKCDLFRSVERQYTVVFQQDEGFLRCFFRQCTMLRAEVVCFLFLGIRIFIWIFKQSQFVFQLQNPQASYNQLFVPQIELYQKTMGIIGLGAIGLWTARMAKGFGMKVIANSRHKKTGPQYDGIEQVSMEEIFERSDVISIHCPHTKETENLLNREAFAKMKDGVIIINTARGIIIDEEALLEALESRKVYMAGLDVVANEPPQYQIPLMQSPYTFITSHIAWQPKAARLRAVDLAVKNFRSYLEGMPTSVIN